MQTFKKNKKRFQTKKFFRKGGVGAASRISRRLTKRNPLYDGSIIDNGKRRKSVRKMISNPSASAPSAEIPAKTLAASASGTPAENIVANAPGTPAENIVANATGTPAENRVASATGTPVGTAAQTPLGTDSSSEIGDLEYFDNSDNFRDITGNTAVSEGAANSLGNTAAAEGAANNLGNSTNPSAANQDVDFDNLFDNGDDDAPVTVPSFGSSEESENTEVTTKIPYCNCSPLFTDKLMDNKVRKNKKLSDFFKNHEIENRSSLQKQLRSLGNRERNSVRRQLINFCTSQNEEGPLSNYEKNFINFVFTDATDETDILIIREKRSKNIKGVLSASLFQDTYMINFLSYDNDEKMGGFMLMVYLLCLNENKHNSGLLILNQGREERELLCLADKYGFAVNENYRATENFPNAVFMEVKLVDGEGRRVLKAKIVNTYLEKCRKFQRQERECGANGYGQNRRVRRNVVQNVEEEGSEEEGEI
jgi:hypothetical protein